MKLPRSAGILLHISSLPGNFGIGTLGHEATGFTETLKKGGQNFWQILPINPVLPTHGFSPYSTTSTFAGNYLLISLEMIAREKWFSGVIDENPFTDGSFIDYEKVSIHKDNALTLASESFFSNADKNEISAYNDFCREMNFWLDDYAMFTSLGEHFKTNNWLEWDQDISARKPAAIKKWKDKLNGRISYHKFLQYVFYKQWMIFKNHCMAEDIKLIGDIPIYVTMDSADVWANPDIFQLNGTSREPVAVSGVPPDYFSETGQHWGNPLYKWHNEDGELDGNTIDWWTKRLLHLYKFVDIIRIDHFRGFEAYWSIPYEEKTAVNGTWIKGPGIDFFKKLIYKIGDINLIAEDLGVITPEVEKLRDKLGFPGMKILQFAFDFNNENYYLTHNIDNRNCIMYTGTHDNNTTNGWFYGKEIDDNIRKYILEYLGSANYNDFHWQLIRSAYRSVANLVIIPAQDILGFGSEFRMNMPGTTTGNWQWKLKKNDITDNHLNTLMRMSQIYNRYTLKKSAKNQ